VLASPDEDSPKEDSLRFDTDTELCGYGLPDGLGQPFDLALCEHGLPDMLVSPDEDPPNELFDIELCEHGWPDMLVSPDKDPPNELFDIELCDHGWPKILGSPEVDDQQGPVPKKLKAEPAWTHQQEAERLLSSSLGSLTTKPTAKQQHEEKVKVKVKGKQKHEEKVKVKVKEKVAPGPTPKKKQKEVAPGLTPKKELNMAPRNVKSRAYHKARLVALRSGLSSEAAKQEARQAHKAAAPGGCHQGALADV